MNQGDDSSYKRTVLYQTEYFEIVSCEWQRGSLSKMHDHGWSQCYALVQEGVFKNITDYGFKTEVSFKEPGQVIVTPLGSKHEIQCESHYGKTLHVYMPKVSEFKKNLNSKSQSSNHLKSIIDMRVANNGMNWEQLTQIAQQVEENSLNTNSVYFMNQLFSGITPQMYLANEVISRTKTTLATYEASPVFTLIEMEVVRSLGALFGWSKDTDGVTVPGGSAANFMALHCARERKFPEAKKSGMPQKKMKIFVSQEAHYSFKKAVQILGFGTESLVLIQTDTKGKLDVEDLSHQISVCLKKDEIPLLVVATAGTTVLGAFDPIISMAEICKQHDIWLHVDAAWGGPAIFSNKIKKSLSGIELADSVTFDGHKLLGAQLTSSFFVTQHPGVLLNANDVSGGEYLFHEHDEVIDRGRMSWQCGRGSDVFSFWLIWKSLGHVGFGHFVDRLLNIRDEVIEWIKKQPSLELLQEPEFLNICVRVKAPVNEDQSKWCIKVRSSLKEENFAMVNYSTDKQGNSFLRFILAHPFLQSRDLINVLTRAIEVK